MNPAVRIFFESLLTRNVAFILFFAVLLPLVCGFTVKQSFRSGGKLSVVALFAVLSAAGVRAALPGSGVVLYPPAVFLLALVALRILQEWGELQGEWAGIPRRVMALIPYAGIMLYVQEQDLSGMDAVSAAFGIAAGLYASVIIVTALIEQIRISEASAPYRRIGVLFLAMAMFALALSGFHFI